MIVIADGQLKSVNINRSMIYWVPLFLFWLIWSVSLGSQNILIVFENYWQSSITMIAGSFVAGATPLGGGAVAFPVFTKIMQVSSSDASFFSLLIQSVGMTFATLFFISRNTMINWKVIRYACIGSFLAYPVSFIYISLENISVRFIFSEFIVFCAFIMLWKKQNQHLKSKSMYWAVLFGFFGGLLTAKIGSGCDVILYFYLVFICQYCAKDSIPTTVCFMAINSIYASVWLLFTSTPSEFVVGSWWASAPIVSIGAPLGAYVLSKLRANQTVIMIISIISIEVLSSLLFAPFSIMNKVTILITITTLLIYTVWQKNVKS